MGRVADCRERDSRLLKKLLVPAVTATGLAILLFGVGQAQALLPSVDVEKTFDAADDTTASGTIQSCDSSDEPVDATIATIKDTVFSKQGRADLGQSSWTRRSQDWQPERLSRPAPVSMVLGMQTTSCRLALRPCETWWKSRWRTVPRPS